MAHRKPSDGDRVWIVNHYASAPDRPTGSRHFDLARNLSARGHRVTIFSAGFSHETGREERLARGRLYRSEWFDGVQFVWLRTVPYRGNTWRRQLNMLSFFAAFVVVQTRWRRPDVVVGSTVQPFAAFGGWLAARLRGTRFVFEIRDLWPQTLVDLGALRVGSPGERLLRQLEAFLVRRASVVITLLPGMRDYLAERRLPSDHVVYIPNGVDLAVFDAHTHADAGAPETVRRTLEEIRRLREEGRFVLGYTGSFGRVNRLDVVIRAAAIAEQRAPGRVGVILVGDGPERVDLERLAETVPAVVIGTAVPRRFVPAILLALDGTVVHATATPVYRYGISFNKLFEYMAAERPIVFATESAYDPVAATGSGITVAPDDPEGLARAFLELAGTTAEERAAMGAAGRAYVVREHNMEHLGEAFAAVVEGRPLADLAAVSASVSPTTSSLGEEPPTA
ncbi:MAG: glycosyltransferase family 4 protein [Candidatus Limnocylindrales bacterium]|jgi:glycosyltransferase involved in cell wall biosynthesis